MRRPKKVTTADVRAWVAAFDAGKSHNEIAETFGFSFSAVRNHLAKSGRFPDAHRRTNESKRIIQLINAGVETRAIVERLGCRVGSVYKLRSTTKNERVQ